MQSLAQQFCNRFKHTKDLSDLKIKMIGRSVSCVKRGDDNIYTMSDCSKLLERVIVNEWQIYDTRTLEITEDMAKIAMLKYPQLASRMRLSMCDTSVYIEILKHNKVTIDKIIKSSGFTLAGVDKSLKRLKDKGYVYRNRVKLSGQSVVMYSPVL